MGLIFFSSMLNLLRGPFIPNEISNAVSILKKKKKEWSKSFMVIKKKKIEKKKKSKLAKTSSGTQFWRLNLLFTDFDWFLNIFGFRVITGLV